MSRKSRLRAAKQRARKRRMARGELRGAAEAGSPEDIFGLLPDELLPQIFRWLPQSEVLSVVPQVCERWAREAANDKRDIYLHVKKDWPTWKRRQALRWKQVRQIEIDELTDWSALICAVQAKRGVREAKIDVTMLLKLVDNLEELSLYRKTRLFVTEGKAFIREVNQFMENAVATGMRIELSFIYMGKYGRCPPPSSPRQEWMKRDGVTWKGKGKGNCPYDPWAGRPAAHARISRTGDLVHRVI